MAENMNLFDMFDFGMEDVPVTEVNEEKKEAKEKKKTPKSSKPKKEVKISLPCKVTTSFSEPIEVPMELGAVSISVAELKEKLATEYGYVCFKHRNYVAKQTKDGAVYLGLSSKDSLAVTDAATQIVSFPVTVCHGMTNAVYEGDMFPGLDEDEVSLSDVTMKFVETNPEFKGLDFSYDADASVIMPVFKQVGVTDKVNAPSTLSVNGVVEDVAEEHAGKKPDEFLQARGLGKTEGVCQYALRYADSSKENYLAVLEVAEKATESTVKAKTVEEKYRLPLKLTVAGIGIDLTSEDFSGKEKVTQKEVISLCETRYKSLFKDAKRTPQFTYSSELSALEIAFTSGKKG